MNKERPSIDGFVPRRIGSQIGELHNSKVRVRAQAAPVDRTLHSGDELREPVGVPRANRAVGRSDIDDSLREIDDEPIQKSTRRSRRAEKIAKKEIRKAKKSKARRITKWVLIILLIAGLGFGVYTGLKIFIAGSNAFKGNLFDFIAQPNQPLKQDSNGRTNILVLGTSEDDPGHQAGNLTDSMMIVSIDQTNKNMYMISIPRDLYVQYGLPCASGYAGKINVYYSCVTDGTGVDAQRAALAKEQAFVGNIFGLDIQYGANVNYTVFRDVVNAVGGSITVTIAGDGAVPYGVPAGSVMDSNFDWKCGASYATKLKNCPPDGHYIQYTAGTHVVDAEHALYLALARGDIAPTYGFAQSNFDREKNQQMIIKAIRDKAASNGLLANVGQALTLISSIGDNLRTNFDTSEVKTLISLSQNIPNSSINSISLVGGDKPIMTTGPVDGQSSVYPAAGTYDYTDLQAFIKQSLSSNPIIRENAPIAVYNGSGISGKAQAEADALTADNYNVTVVATAPSGTYAPYELYQVGTGNSATKSALEKLLGVTTKTTKPPVTTSLDSGFIIIIGTQPTPTSGQ